MMSAEVEVALFRSLIIACFFFLLFDFVRSRSLFVSVLSPTPILTDNNNSDVDS
jgi:hypothetical protein